MLNYNSLVAAVPIKQWLSVVQKIQRWLWGAMTKTLFPSLYNQIFELEQGKYVFLNLLSGACDVGDEADLQVFEKGSTVQSISPELLDRGYFFKSAEEEKTYTTQRFADFNGSNSTNETQFILVPTYGCNFNCAYCYQKGLEGSSALMSQEVVAAFFKFVVDYRNQQKRSVMVTLFGGEPLLNSAKQKDLIRSIVAQAKLHDIELSVVTNGYNLEEYIPILQEATIREIHVSLDGSRHEHNKRRKTKDGLDSFDRILNGLIKAAQVGFPINIRLIIDRQTMFTLPALAQTLQEVGLFSLPVGKFKTSMGRNYELINEYVTPADLYSLDEMVKEYVKLAAVFSILKKLHVPSFFGITQLVTRGEMYMPSFDTCPAGKSEFVFDASGRIFGCTASCGREGYELGTFYPQVSWEKSQLQQWQERNILAIEQCETCSVGVVCGGGCGVISKDRTGSIMAPNCKPIKAIMQEGVSYYKEHFLSQF